MNIPATTIPEFGFLEFKFILGVSYDAGVHQWYLVGPVMVPPSPRKFKFFLHWKTRLVRF